MRFPSIALLLLFITATGRAWTSSMVQLDAQGRLSYPADASGNRIPDFSHAGYKGGGVPLPTNIPIVRTLEHAGGDQTARIQSALDEIAALPLQPNGYRGTLQLAAGTWEVPGTLRLRANGLVLAGVGDRDDPATNTILRRTGTSQAAIIQAGNRNDSYRSEIPNTRAQITTPRVTVGARSFEVDQPALYRIGDAVIVVHPSTQPWLDAVNRGGVTDNNFWRPGEIDIRYHRYIAAVAGNTITLDAPVFNHLDRSLSQSYLFKYDAAHVVKHVGIEKLQVDIVTKGELTEEHAGDAITFTGAEDSWIRDCTMKHFWHAGVQWEGSTRCTAERCRAIEPHSIVTGSRRYNFSMYHAQLILVQDCFADRARHAYVCNGTSLDSGIVFLNCITDRALTSSEGHRRWSTGLLYDGLVATNRQSTDILGLYNRGNYGTGHGWAAAHSVAWNCNASTGGRIWIQRPPTAQNYGIGCSGNVTGTGPFAGPAGHIEGTNQAGLEPQSLYRAQLAQRLADAAQPAITVPPLGRAIIPGDTVIFTVGASGAAPTFQWSFNGTPIAGATQSTLTIVNATPADAGNYAVALNRTDATATATLTVAPSDDPGRLVNLAIRSAAGAGAQTLIVGAALGGNAAGTAARPLLFRAAGPSLAPFGVTGAIADPALTIFRETDPLAQNNDWAGDAAIANAATRVGAFGFAATTSKDAALLHPGLPTGTYSMQVTAATGASGIALAEVYDTGGASSAAPRLVNLSARTQVGTGANLLIAGFALGGVTSKTVLIRAVGPGLTAFGVTGVLADPKLELYSDSTLIATNDNWADQPALAAAFSSVAAFALPAGSRDAALLITLAPGSYTAQVSGIANTTGVALVEVYAVNP